MISTADIVAYTVVGGLSGLAAVKQMEHGKDGDGVFWRKCLLLAVACAIAVLCADPRPVAIEHEHGGGGVYFARSSLLIFCALYLACSVVARPDDKMRHPPSTRAAHRKYTPTGPAPDGDSDTDSDADAESSSAGK